MRIGLTLLLSLTVLVSFAQSYVQYGESRVALERSTDWTDIGAGVLNPPKLVRFAAPLTLAQQEALANAGVSLLSAFDGLYIAKFDGPQALYASGVPVIAMGEIPPEAKLSGRIDTTRRSEKLSLQIMISGKDVENEITSFIQKHGGEIADSRTAESGLLLVTVPGQFLNQLAAHPDILWIEPEAPADEPIRYRAMGTMRTLPLLGTPYDLSGHGVTVGVGDAGKVGGHIDMDGHLENYALNGVHNHATHVSGIIGAKANLDPRQGSGIAPGVSIVTSFYSEIIRNSDRHMADHNMSITNNSYGGAQSSCELFGDYSLSSVIVDDQIHANDTLLHVFAAGNSGGLNCGPYSSGYATILTGFQSSKNVLCVGSTDHTDGLSNFSSRGPVDDGRLKPDVVGVGSGVTSTRPNNTFAGGSGTSYSAPAVTGICALISQEYQELFGEKPGAALLKAMVMNTSDDLGNPHPDYRFGYGRVNATRAIDAVRDSLFVTGTLAQGDSLAYTVNVPPNTAQIKVMALWIDPAGLPFASPALINDLDLEVTDPNGTSMLPWVLDPSPTGAEMPATRGRDSLNTQEQVTIDNPATGTYTVSVKGQSIPIGLQDFVIVYDLVAHDLKVTNPVGGSVLMLGTSENIRWDAYGNAVGPFDIEYTTNGSDWIDIASGVSQNRRHFSWQTPFAISDNVQVRITGSNGFVDTSAVFGTLSRPNNLAINALCRGYSEMTWNSVSGADHYNIYMYNGSEMVLLDTAQTTSYLIADPYMNSTWYSVATVHSTGMTSMRTPAKRATFTNTDSCPWSDDLAITGLPGFESGRVLTNSALPGDFQVRIACTNVGNSVVDSFELSFQLNDGPVFTDLVISTLPPGESDTFSIGPTLDLSAPGEYTLRAFVTLTGDPAPGNDTIFETVRNIANAPVLLPFNASFEGALDTEYITSTTGLDGADPWDYIGNARLRMWAGQDFIIDGERAMTLDNNSGGFASHEVRATFNMSAYNAAENDIRLNFDFMHHEIDPDDDINEVVRIRGSETSDWIEMADLFDYYEAAGSVTNIRELKISDALNNAGQQFSTSFQLSFVQQGNGPAVQADAEDGYTIDNIEFYSVKSDISLGEIVYPSPSACGLSSNEAISVLIENTSSNPAENIAVTYVFEGDTVTELMPFLGPLESAEFTFASTVDMSAQGAYDIDIWIAPPEDAYAANDTLRNKTIFNNTFITSKPYIEDFENGDGGWRTYGVNTSFELGAPSGSIIREAASGGNAWVTNLDGTYNTNEFSYLSSPCIDLTAYDEPILSFAHIYQLENNYDYLRVEISENGLTWSPLGSPGEGTAWYNDDSGAWDNSNASWHVASIPLPQINGTIQLRFVMTSDIGLEYEGTGIDLIHIHEARPVFSSAMTADTSQTVADDAWAHFEKNGEVYASLLSNSPLGEVNISTFYFADDDRNNGVAYLLARNWVVDVTNDPDSTALLRLYFDSETADLLADATGCPSCISSTNIFRDEAFSYRGINEDSLISNNTSGDQTWYESEDISILPYENGYYAELAVDSFSEFWIISPRVRFADSIVYPIASASDDATEFTVSGGVDPFGDTLRVDADYITGLRFANINIPQDAVILESRLILTAAGNSNAQDLLLQPEAFFDADPFTTGNFNISNRFVSDISRTIEIPATAPDSEVTSPDIRALIQNTIESDNWQAGDAIGFRLSGSQAFKSYSRELSPPQSARLYVLYDSVCVEDRRLYVNASADGDFTGFSWPNAMSSLREALMFANKCPDIDEIWVAAGTYTPADFNYLESFTLRDGLVVLGGFDGSEISAGDRDPLANPTILSGEINDPEETSDNVWNVVEVPPNNTPPILDGMIITDGQAFGPWPETKRGGGIYSNGSVTLKNCIIENCSSELDGSAVYHTGNGQVLRLIDCTLRQNGSPAIFNESAAEIKLSGINLIEDNE